MKKLLFSFLVLGITSVLAIGATTAYFSDTEISAGNTFTAGTLQLDVQGVNEATETYSFSNIKPGDTGGWVGYHDNPQYSSGRPYWTVTNTGSLPGTLTVTIENITDKNANGDVIPMADGAMSWAMRIQLRVNGTVDYSQTGKGHLGRNNWVYEIDLGPGEHATFDYAWHLNAAPSGGWNVLQGHSTEFDVKFELVQ
jgi:predicted ribosomally synthesized peptide with SipW-like signal peptide